MGLMKVLIVPNLGAFDEGFRVFDLSQMDGFDERLITLNWMPSMKVLIVPNGWVMF